MSGALVYTIVLYVFLGIALVTFISLFFTTAPYGRHAKSGWGPLIPNTPAWILMEAPAALLFLAYFLFMGKPITASLVAFLVLWQAHYIHRAFIYPFQIRGNGRMAVSVMLMGMLFNAINTYIQGAWLFRLAPQSRYGTEWLADPRFIIGTAVFVTGYAINKHADRVLRKLRDPHNPGYKIPYGGMYRYLSCPNYFGELLTWGGWALLSWSVAGLFFFIWSAANLVPRAYANHRWYLEKFPDYPKERKAVLPGIF